MTGFLMGNLFGTSRLVFALGRDGYLPRVFGTVSAKHRVPLSALAAHACWRGRWRSAATSTRWR